MPPVINKIYITRPSQDLEVVYKGTYIFYFYFIDDQTEQIKRLEQVRKKSVAKTNYWWRAIAYSSRNVKMLKYALSWKVALHLTADISAYQTTKMLHCHIIIRVLPKFKASTKLFLSLGNWCQMFIKRPRNFSLHFVCISQHIVSGMSVKNRFSLASNRKRRKRQ